MFCTKCGTAIEDGKSVCPKCNASIGSTSPMNRVSETQSAKQRKESHAVKKSGTSKLVKILSSLAVVIGIGAYNGWVIWYNNGGGAVKETTEKILVELIPQSLNEDVVEFVEVENFKIDSTAKHKWAGEANAKVKVKESGKTGNIRFTFDVEEKKEDKGEMVYVQNLLMDEASAAKLLGEDTKSQGEEANAGSVKAEITNWSAYVHELKEKAEKLTSIQRTEAKKKEEGRTVEDVFEVVDVFKETEGDDDGEHYEIARIHAETVTGCKVHILVPNVENSAAAYKMAINMSTGVWVKSFGVVYFEKNAVFSMPLDEPSIVATKLEIVEDGK